METNKLQITLDQMNGQVAAITALIAAGYAVTESVVRAWKILVATLHPDLTQAQIDAAWDVVKNDALIGLAIAKAQSGQ